MKLNKEGFICISDRELKNFAKEDVFVIITEKQAKSHKKFYEKNYNIHHNILKIKINLKEV